MEDLKSLKKTLNNIQLEGFENIKCGDMLHYSLIRGIANNGSQGVKASLKFYIKVIRLLMTEVYKVESSGDASSLFVFSSAYGARKDLLNNFTLVSDLIKNRVVIYAYPHYKCSLKKLRYLKQIKIWKKLLLKEIKNKSLCYNIIFDLVRVYLEYQEILSKIDFDKIKSLVSFCDVHPTESFLTQLFNNMNRCTVTLQHGVYSSEVNEWVFSGSKSRYLLGYGNFTIDEGSKNPLYHGNILSVGSMSFIGKERIPKPDQFTTNKIGLVLDGEDGIGLHELNERFIKFSQNYCKTRNIKLLVKFHPASDIKTYLDVIDNNVVESYYGSDLSIMDFMNKIDVALVRNSTCAIETLHFWIPTYIFSEEAQTIDVYKNVNDCKFSNEEELDQYITNINSPEMHKKISDLRDYFCVDDNMEKRFTEVLNGLGIV